jgi:hypothetical protein
LKVAGVGLGAGELCRRRAQAKFQALIDLRPSNAFPLLGQRLLAQPRQLRLLALHVGPSQLVALAALSQR